MIIFVQHGSVFTKISLSRHNEVSLNSFSLKIIIICLHFRKFLLTFFFAILSFAFAQNDQAITIHVSSESHLYIQSANVSDENLPVRFETDYAVNDENITYLTFDSAVNPPYPRLIEVLHPAILEKFPNVQELSLTGCKMKRILENSLGECRILRMLWLMNNLIEEIPAGFFKNCTILTSVLFSSNKISRLEPKSFEGLAPSSSLYLDDNQLTTISSDLFMHVPSMYSLYIGSNPIQVIQPGSFPTTLTWLSLSNSNITELHPEIFHNLTQLTYLYLYYNPITKLPPGIFTHLDKLSLLHLEFCNIRRLNSDSFGRLRNLHYLRIQSNGLDEIQPGFLENFPNLYSFFASNNTCINDTLNDPSSINFNTNPILNQCFANWYVPRESTTPSGSGMIVANIILILSSGMIKFINYFYNQNYKID